MLTRLVGDIHGDFNGYKRVLEGCKQSIQVGDFGIGFGSSKWHAEVNAFHSNLNHRFIRGNHDDPDYCTKMTGYIEDGSIESDVMFVGGAYSIDAAYRVEGVSWWADEELSYKRWDAIIEAYIQHKPRIMITHDAPTDVTRQMFIYKGLGNPGKHNSSTRTQEALQAMFDIHAPEAWFFGHWHHHTAETIRGTAFQCIGINEYIDVELG